MTSNYSSLNIIEDLFSDTQLDMRFTPSEAIISNEVLERLETAFEYIFTFLLCVVGTIGNVVNIGVFYKLGYNETINISLTTIAIWDLIKSLFGFIDRTRGFMKPILSPASMISYDTIVTVVFSFSSFYSTTPSYMIGAYVAVERCLCVSLPFKVKFLLTPKFVTCAMIMLSILSFASRAIVYIGDRIVWEFRSDLNTSVAVFSDSETSLDMGAFSLYFETVGVVGVVLCLAIQCTSFIVISHHLSKAHAFRSKTAGKVDDPNVSSKLSSRDKQITKMLLVIIFLYIVCLFPTAAFDLAKATEHRFFVFNEYHNLFKACSLLMHFFAHINASVNCFIFYNMSSQYKSKFLNIFCQKRMDKKSSLTD